MIFRAYDIRGIYPQELNPQLAMKIGQAFGNIVPGEIIVGQDMRTSSPIITRAFISGLLSSGNSVTSIGMVASPVLYFAVVTRKSDGGAIITASHNPPEYAGMKLCRKNAVCLTDDSGIQEIKQKIGKNQLVQVSWDKIKTLNHLNIVPDYISHLSKLVNPEKKLKVVVDVGNGTCGFTRKLFEQFCDVKMLFEEPDGRFPNHNPDPLKEENVAILKKEVIKQKADLGIAFDGDGDRVGFVDDKGNFLLGDIATMLFAKNELEKKPGGKILYEVRCSRGLGEFIKKHGGNPQMIRIGHSYIHHEVLKQKALLAGEISGHFYFGQDYFGYDDGPLAALKMIEAISKFGKLSEFVKTIPQYAASPEYRIYCQDEKKFGVVESLKKEFEKEKVKIIDIDGLRVEFPDGWILARASNTQPAIVARAEGKDKPTLKKLESFLLEKIKSKLGELKFV